MTKSKTSYLWMVKLRFGGMLSFGTSLLTDEENALAWAAKLRGVAVPTEIPSKRPIEEKKKTRRR